MKNFDEYIIDKLDEAATMQQRLKMKAAFRKNKSKIAL